MIDGRRSYVKFERRADRTLPQTGTSRFPLWYRFEVNGFPLFMIDTRTERTPRTARTVASARIVSEGQMKALLDWLSEPSEMPKIIASPAMLLPRHARAVQRKRIESALRSDGWDGYPQSLHRVLAFIARRRIPNVVFLSGDEQQGCIARIRSLATTSYRSSSIQCTARHSSRRFRSRTRSPRTWWRTTASISGTPQRKRACFIAAWRRNSRRRAMASRYSGSFTTESDGN
jgi:hypothetical protein